MRDSSTKNFGNHVLRRLVGRSISFESAYMVTQPQSWAPRYDYLILKCPASTFIR